MPYFELLVLLIFILLNGVLSMSELAIVSAKKTYLRQLAEEGNTAARTALDLAADTAKFLPTVQIGITMIGILAGAFGGATLSRPLARLLEQAGMRESPADFLAVSIVVVLVTYVTLVIGELVPKELALRRPERFALFVAPLIRLLSVLTWPAVSLLGWSSTLVLRLIRAGDKPEPTVTQQDVEAIIEEGTGQGALAPRESEMLSGVMLLADRPVRAFMTPRIDVAALRGDSTTEDIHNTIKGSGYSRFPVLDRESDSEVLGIVQTKDILETILAGKALGLQDLVRPVSAFPENAAALQVMEHLRQAPIHMAIVVDEYGSFEGIVTLYDLFRAIAGEIHAPSGDEQSIVQREDGSWLMDGGVLIDRAFREIGLTLKENNKGFHTLAGFILHQCSAIPQVGHICDHDLFRFEVVDMDGYRIDKILIRRLPAPPEQAEQPA